MWHTDSCGSTAAMFEPRDGSARRTNRVQLRMPNGHTQPCREDAEQQYEVRLLLHWPHARSVCSRICKNC